MSTSTVLFTDTSSELTLDRCAQLGITRLDLGCHFKNSAWTDFDDVDGFYQKLSPDNIAKTSAVNVQKFIDYFTPALQAGKNILCLPLAGSLSSTYRNAKIAGDELAEKYPDRQIHVIDSRCVCGGLEFLITEVVERMQTGTPLPEIIQYIEKTKPLIATHFTLDSLEYLYRGGRITGAQKVLGGIMGVRPILHFDDQDQLTKRGAIRGMLKALEAIADEVSATISPHNRRIIISFANNQQSAEILHDLVLSSTRVPDAQVEIGRVGPTIGTHVGPTAVGAFFEATKR